MVRIGKRSRAGCACLVAALCICIADEGGSPRLGLTARPRDATQLIWSKSGEIRRVLALVSRSRQHLLQNRVFNYEYTRCRLKRHVTEVQLLQRLVTPSTEHRAPRATSLCSSWARYEGRSTPSWARYTEHLV